MTKQTYEILGNVRYGGVLHKPAPKGQRAKTVDMEPDAAQAPMDLGALRPMRSHVQVEAHTVVNDSEPVITVGGAAAVTMLASLIQSLPSEDFDEDGMPSIDVLNVRASADMKGTVAISPMLLEPAMAEVTADRQKHNEAGGGDGGAEDPVVAAIRALTPEDFGADGAPKLNPLRKALKRKVTDEERDAAWAVVQAERDGAAT